LNKQQKTYILLIAVVAIWGVIVYTFYSYRTPKEITRLDKKIYKREKVNTYNQSKEKLTITTYKDPFLGKLKVKPKKKAIKKPITTIPFPNVSYNGALKGNNTSQYLISVNNEQEILKIGAIFKQVKLVKATNNEIIVEYKNTQKIIELKQ
jgi:Tfp pilus assembly protein PilP